MYKERSITLLPVSAAELQWECLCRLAEDLRLARSDVAQRHGMSHVFCRHSYGLRNVCLDHPTLVLILEGSKRYGTETCPGASPSLSTVAAPALLFLPADTPLSIENIPATGSARYLAFCLSFRPPLLDAVAQHWPLRESTAGTLPPQTAPALLTALQLLLHTATDPSAHECPRLLDIQCEQILLLLALHGLAPYIYPRRDALVSEALERIQQQPHLPWTLDALAESLHCSARTLRRRMQQEGRGLREILRHARLHTALAMLQQQRCTVSEAAFSCGYDSPSRFSQRFREHFGLLPSELLRVPEAARGELLA